MASENRKRGFVPDFEIRYFHADGSLGLIRITHCPSLAEAEEYARSHLCTHARFEVRESKGALLSR
jgi:hypothetical protein